MQNLRFPIFFCLSHLLRETSIKSRWIVATVFGGIANKTSAKFEGYVADFQNKRIHQFRNFFPRWLRRMSWRHKKTLQIPAQDFLAIVIPAIEGSAINQQERTQPAVSCRSRERAVTRTCVRHLPRWPTLNSILDLSPGERSIDRSAAETRIKVGGGGEEREKRRDSRQIYIHGKRLYSGHHSVRRPLPRRVEPPQIVPLYESWATFFSRSINQCALNAYWYAILCASSKPAALVLVFDWFPRSSIAVRNFPWNLWISGSVSRGRGHDAIRGRFKKKRF